MRYKFMIATAVVIFSCATTIRAAGSGATCSVARGGADTMRGI